MHSIVHRAGHRASALVLVAVLMTLALAPASGAPQRAYSYDGPLEHVVLDWNLNAVQALISGPTATPKGLGQPPPVSIIHLAMMHGAIYDAVNAIDGGHQPYLGGLPAAPASSSKAAAVATAAHDVLIGIVSDPRAQAAVSPQPAPTAEIIARLHALRDATIAAALAADGPASTEAGVAAGAAAAAAMLDERAGDGRYGAFRFTSGNEPGAWRIAAPVANAFDWVAQVRPFVIESPSQFRTKGPQALTSSDYAKDFNELKALGSATSVRTIEQQAVVDFYRNSTNPVELFNRAFRALATERGLTLVEQARLFGMLNLAGADSLIGCWDDKAHWSFWRPTTAIREGDNDGNPKTVGDPTWVAYEAIPPYPDHPSGYNCVTAAFMFTAGAFFGSDKASFAVERIVPGGTNIVRRYERFSDVCADTIDARVFQGIHFRTADTQGAELGQDVARWVTKHAFGPAK